MDIYADTTLAKAVRTFIIGAVPVASTAIAAALGVPLS